jgi:hypothetical protein
MMEYELSDRLARFEYAITDAPLQQFSPTEFDPRVAYA